MERTKQMPSVDVTKKYWAIDLKTDITYGLKIDAEGNCTSAQVLPTGVVNMKGEVIAVSDPDPGVPFGETITAVEMNGESYGKVFTLVWPSEKDWNKGARPAVTMKDLPDDLVKAGIAPPPKSASGAVDMDIALGKALKNIDHMIGLDSAKRDIKQNISVARFNEVKRELGLESNPISRHMVFTGNPGTGKTTFAREVAKVYKALGFIEKDSVLEVKREDLVAGYVGQTALKTKEVIDKAKGGVLFIDEAYALSRSANAPGGSNDFGREAIDTLVAAMENMREDLIVIVAGYQEPMKKFIDANEGLKSRFMTYITFEDYTVPQLGQILDVMLKDRGYTLDADARALAMTKLEKEKSRVQAKDFGNGRIVRNLVEKAEKELAERAERDGLLSVGRGGLNKEDLKTALTTLTLADIKGVSLDSISSKGSTVAKPIEFGKVAGKKAPANDTQLLPAVAMAAAPQKKRASAKAAFKP